MYLETKVSRDTDVGLRPDGSVGRLDTIYEQ